MQEQAQVRKPTCSSPDPSFQDQDHQDHLSQNKQTQLVKDNAREDELKGAKVTFQNHNGIAQEQTQLVQETTNGDSMKNPCAEPASSSILPKFASPLQTGGNCRENTHSFSSPRLQDHGQFVHRQLVDDTHQSEDVQTKSISVSLDQEYASLEQNQNNISKSPQAHHLLEDHDVGEKHSFFREDSNRKVEMKPALSVACFLQSSMSSNEPNPYGQHAQFSQEQGHRAHDGSRSISETIPFKQHIIEKETQHTQKDLLETYQVGEFQIIHGHELSLQFLHSFPL